MRRPAPTPPPSEDSLARFRALADQIKSLGAAFGVGIVPYRDDRLPHFHALSEKMRYGALRILEHQRDFLLAASAESLHPNDPKLIWRTLAKMGMTPLSDIFSKITVDDTVEVYHWDGTTSFKNLKFFEFISLSLEEIYCLTWTQQRIHSPEVFFFFVEMNAKLRIAHYKKTFTPRFNRYYVTEKLGEKRTFYIHLKWVSPVTQDGVKCAVICVNRSSFADLAAGKPGDKRIGSEQPDPNYKGDGQRAE